MQNLLMALRLVEESLYSQLLQVLLVILSSVSPMLFLSAESYHGTFERKQNVTVTG